MEVWGVDVCVVRGGCLLLFPSFYVHIVMVAEDTVNNHTLRMGGGGRSRSHSPARIAPHALQCYNNKMFSGTHKSFPACDGNKPSNTVFHLLTAHCSEPESGGFWGFFF